MGSRAPRPLAERSRLVSLEQRRAELRREVHVDADGVECEVCGRDDFDTVRAKNIHRGHAHGGADA